MTLATTDTGGLAWPMRNVAGKAAVRARILTRLHTVQGERPDDITIGIPASWLEGSPVPRGQAEAAVRGQLRAVSGVVQVTLVTVSDATTGRTVSGSVVAQTSEGLETVSIGAPLPYDTRGAPAWYMTSGTLRTGRGPSWTGA